MTEYTSVKVPKRLAEIIKDSKIFKDYGYRSVSEFMLSVSRRIAEEGKY